MLLPVHRSVVFEIFKKFFYLGIFTDKKILRCDNTDSNMVFKVFLLSRFHIVFLPTTLASLPSRIMLLSRSIAPRDSATDIEKHPEKAAEARAT